MAVVSGFYSLFDEDTVSMSLSPWEVNFLAFSSVYPDTNCPAWLGRNPYLPP